MNPLGSLLMGFTIGVGLLVTVEQSRSTSTVSRDHPIASRISGFAGFASEPIIRSIEARALSVAE